MITRATALLVEGLALRRDLGDQRGIAACIEGLARAATAPDVAPEMGARGARLLGAVTLRAAIGAPLPPNERAVLDHTVAVLHATLGDAAYEAA